jgi:VWFA-related protein
MDSRAERVVPPLLIAAAAAAVLSCAVAVAQNPQDQQYPDTPPAGQTEVTVTADQLPPTLRASARRITVDVVVTDAKGRPVTGLSRGDFTIYEDGVLQPMRSFEPFTPAKEIPYVPPQLPKLPPNTFLNLATAPATGTPTVLLYDVLNTPPEAQGYAHEEMIGFIKHRKPGTQIAIFVLSDKLHLLQGFTDDEAALTRSLDRKSGQVTHSTQLSEAGSTPTSATDLAPSAAAGDPKAYSNTNVSQTVDTLHSFEALEQSYMLDQRIDITLDAMTEIGRFLAGLPGRKNLIWLSGSFPSGVLPGTNFNVTTLASDQATRNFGDQMKQATDLLNLGHVAVYPVDVRGIIVPPVGGTQTMFDFVSRQGRDHTTMDTIAEDTGGHAYYNTNDVQGAVEKAVEDGSTYYSMTYEPTNKNLDGGLRKIKVKLKEPGYQLSYRTTYYADDLLRAAQEVADAPQSPLSPSLERGAPMSHELLVVARMQPVGDPVAATPKQLEMLAEYEAMTATNKKKSKKAARPPANVLMQSYLITFGLLPRQLELRTQPNGAHRASIELGVLSYDQDGRKLNGIDTQIEDNIPPQRYAQIPQEGYHLFQTVVIPVTAASVRLAVRDTVANRVGSLEVQLPLEKTP